MKIEFLTLGLLFVLILPAFAVQTKIQTSPSGAEVWIDGVDRGKTPFQAEIARPFSYEIRQPGRKTVSGVSQPGQKLFAYMLPTNSVFQFTRQLKCGQLPKDLIYSPDDRYLMIPCMGESGIDVYDMKTLQMRRIAIPKYNRYVGYVEGVFTPDGKEFWFTQVSEVGKVFVLDMATLTVKKEIATRGNWTKVGEFSPDGEYYYVSNWLSDDISVIRVKDYSFVRKIKTPGKAPRGVGFSLDGRYLYVVFYDSGEIMKFDLKDHDRLVKRIKNGGTNGRFRVDPVRRIAYINNMRLAKVFIYDLDKDEITGDFKTWVHPNNVKIAPGRRYIYVSNRGPNNPKSYEMRSPENGRIMIFDAEKNYSLVESITVGNQPIGIALTSDGKTLAVCNFMDATIDFFEMKL